MILGFTKTMLLKGKRKPTNFVQKILSGDKIHTVRWDSKERWSMGKKIHFATGVRTNKYNCFKEGVCKGVQAIRIVNRYVIIDEVPLDFEEIAEFARNDGFDSVDDFWEWFDMYSPFDGKVIHWTNKLY